MKLTCKSWFDMSLGYIDLNFHPRHLDGTLTTLRYHGPKRKTLVLEDADIILTTYHTIVSDFGDKSSPLHAMEWYRVVLDEGILEYEGDI
jgi:SNF2 family DNA or RNA helicase